MVGRNGLTAATLGLPSPIGVNTGNNTFWLQGQKTVNLTSIISLEPGEYQVTAEVAASVSGTRYYFQLMPRTGQSSIPYIVVNQLAGVNSTTFQQYTNSFTVSEAQSGEHVLRIYANHSNGTANPDGYQWFRNVSIRKRMGGELIVDGAITARNMAAESVTADALAANSVTAVKIASGQVTTVKLAAGAVTSEKLTASRAMVDQLFASEFMSGRVLTEVFQLGDNVRWTDDGLTFYTPVVGNQSVTDWANRQALISITPSGDSSITVSEAGEPTGGINPDGTVWGHAGSFDTLEVGGTLVTNIDGPRGVQSVTMLDSDTSLATDADTLLLWTSIDVEPDRMYEVEAHVFVRDPGNVTLRWRRNSGGPPTTGNSVRSEIVVNGDAHRIINFKHLMFQPLTGGDNTGVATTYVGLFISGASASTTLIYGPHSDTGEPRTMLTVRDIGPTVDIDTQTVASTSNPKRTYTKTYKTTGVKRYNRAGGTATDSRNIVAGSYFGSAMSENLLYQMPSSFYSDLQGATIKSAKVSVRCTKTYSNGTPASIYVGYTNASGLPSTFPSKTNMTAMDIKAGETLTNNISSGYFGALIGARGITVSPRNGGSLSSYAYMDASTTQITVTYVK